MTARSHTCMHVVLLKLYRLPLSTEYLEAVKKTPYMTLEELMTFTMQYGDVYFHPVSTVEDKF